jgi:pimeloyl-ACP methyl ester carboxylesterase
VDSTYYSCNDYLNTIFVLSATLYNGAKHTTRRNHIRMNWWLIRFIVKFVLVLVSSLFIIIELNLLIPRTRISHYTQQWPNKEDVIIPQLAHYKQVHLPNSKHNVTLTILEGGSSSESLLIFLHGYPESALIAWGPFLDRFITAGYHVIAMDMRGFNTSSKPESQEAYNVKYVAEDTKMLITEYAKKENATVIACDWGAMAAWDFAELYPQHLERLVISVPKENTPLSFSANVMKQLTRSYFYFFLIDGFVERSVMKDDFAAMFENMNIYELGNKGVVSTKFADLLLSYWKSSNFTIMGHYYRAFVKDPHTKDRHKNVRLTVPVLVLHPSNDPFMTREAIQSTFEHGVLNHNNKSKLVTLNSGHWYTIEQSEETFNQILSFLQETS